MSTEADLPASLLECAMLVLTESNPDAKATLTHATFAKWKADDAMPIAPTDGSHPAPPDEPSRPSHVALVPPGATRTRSIKDRVHSLVHAESYAIDLSWDIQVRFAWLDGDELMPRSFFDDWTRVAEEEAQHYQAWQARLLEMGMAYGDTPGHDSLWESATATFGSLPDRLAIIHCTHEARGLDHSGIMVKRLEKAGDTASLAILEKNVREEVGHVGFGVKWLKWMADRTGVESTVMYRDALSRCFRGALKPPFNTELRDKADMPRSWYEDSPAPTPTPTPTPAPAPVAGDIESKTE